MHYDAETFAQYVTVTHAFLSMLATAEEELKMFYFTAFGAQLPSEHMTKTTTGHRSSFHEQKLHRLHVLTHTVSVSLPSHVLGKMSLLNWLSRTKTHSKAKNTDSDKIVAVSSQSNVTANDGDATAQPSTKPEKSNITGMKNHVSL